MEENMDYMISDMVTDMITDMNINNVVFYTLIYCEYHDDGWLIRGNHDYVPHGYQPRHSDKCEACDWYENGIISYDGKNIKIIKEVRINYDRYNGGFSFNIYPCEVTDENGTPLDYEYEDEIKDEYMYEYDRETPLSKWFDEVVKLNLNTEFIDETFDLLNM